MSKYILGQVFLDRYEVEKAHRQMCTSLFGGCETDAEWEEYASSKARKVFTIVVGIPVGIVGAAVGIAWTIATAPLRIFAKIVKEVGEVYLISTNPFVLYKESNKEASE